MHKKLFTTLFAFSCFFTPALGIDYSKVELSPLEKEQLKFVGKPNGFMLSTLYSAMRCNDIVLATKVTQAAPSETTPSDILITTQVSDVYRGKMNIGDIITIKISCKFEEMEVTPEEYSKNLAEELNKSKELIYCFLDSEDIKQEKNGYLYQIYSPMMDFHPYSRSGALVEKLMKEYPEILKNKL